MAGSITVSSITLDSDNNFSIKSNTGATLFSANGSGIVSGVQNTAISGVITGTQLAVNSVNSTIIAANTISNTNIQTGAIENYLNSQSLFFGNRNKIINGAMTIDQRNAGANVTFGTGTSTSDNYTAYTLDRWFAQSYQSTAGKGGTFVVQRNGGSITPPTGFQNYVRAIVTYAQTDVATDSSLYRFNHKLEGYGLLGSGWVTAAAQPMTLSFWARSSLTGTYTIHLDNNVDLNYTTTYTINSANTWEKKVLVIPGPTTGTWETTNSLALNIDFTLAASTGRTGGTLNSWLADTKQAATGQVNWMATLGNTYCLTGVQFEIGSQATPFEFRQIGQELALCQRYYWKNSPESSYGWIASGRNQSGYISAIVHNPVIMRAAPTFSYSSLGSANGQPTGQITGTYGGTQTSLFQPTMTNNNETAGYMNSLQQNGTASSGYLAASAEL